MDNCGTTTNDGDALCPLQYEGTSHQLTCKPLHYVGGPSTDMLTCKLGLAGFLYSRLFGQLHWEGHKGAPGSSV